MRPAVTREQRDANRTANFIEKHADIYQRCPIFRSMVDSTVYLTDDQIHESMQVVGGTLLKGRYDQILPSASPCL